MKATLLAGLFAGLVLATPIEDTPTKVLQARASPACSYVQVTPPNGEHPYKVVCGGHGHLKHPAPLGSPIPALSDNDCRDMCFKNQRCISFGYNPSTSSCQQYTKFIIKMGYVRSSTGDVSFYNRRCYSKECDAPIPPSCDNEGIQYAVFNNPSENPSGSGYPLFDPTVFATETPLFQSTTNSIGGINVEDGSSTITIYNSSYTRDIQHFAIDHRGYFFATTTGTYNFSIPNGADDIVEFWVGSKAYSGWDRANADIDLVCCSGAPLNVPFPLTAGQYIPFRIVYGNAQSGAFFQASITDPNGNVVVDSTSGPSMQIVQYSCDGTTAPPYAPFGSESAGPPNTPVSSSSPSPSPSLPPRA